jgi:hypothetical protein
MKRGELRFNRDPFDALIAAAALALAAAVAEPGYGDSRVRHREAGVVSPYRS